MEIEYAGDALTIHASQPRAVERIRQQPEVATAGTGPVPTQQPDSGHWNLDDAVRLRQKRCSRRIRHAVEVMTNGIDAGAVAIPLLAKNRVGPQGRRIDRK